MGTKLFRQPRRVRVHVNIHADKIGLAKVYTIHVSDRCIPAREVRIACTGEFTHDLRAHAKGVNPHIYFTCLAQAYDLGNGSYELRDR